MLSRSSLHGPICVDVEKESASSSCSGGGGDGGGGGGSGRGSSISGGSSSSSCDAALDDSRGWSAGLACEVFATICDTKVLHGAFGYSAAILFLVFMLRQLLFCCYSAAIQLLFC